MTQHDRAAPLTRWLVALVTAGLSPDEAANWLASHPRIACALLIAMILVAGQMDGGMA